MPATITNADLHPAANPDLNTELGVPADCGHRNEPGNPCVRRAIKLADINVLAAEIAILRDRAAEEQLKTPSRRRGDPIRFLASAADRAAQVQELLAALPPCAMAETIQTGTSTELADLFTTLIGRVVTIAFVIRYQATTVEVGPEQWDVDYTPVVKTHTGEVKRVTNRGQTVTVRLDRFAADETWLGGDDVYLTGADHPCGNYTAFTVRIAE